MKTKRKKIDLLHFPSSYYHSFRSRSNENLKIEKTQNFTYKYHQNYISYNFFHIISAFGILHKFSTHSDFNILRDVFTKKFSAVSNTVKFSSKTNVRGATIDNARFKKFIGVVQDAWTSTGTVTVSYRFFRSEFARPSSPTLRSSFREAH